MICIVGNNYELGKKIDFSKFDEVWTLNDGFLKYPSTLHFDMHDWVNSEYLPRYYEDMKNSNVKKILMVDDKNMSNYELLPFDEIKCNFGNIMTYSISYLLGYAYIENKREIFIGGMDIYYLIKNPIFGFSLYYIIGCLEVHGFKITYQDNFFNFKDYGFNLKWHHECEKYGAIRKVL